ncbi:hypothetical protein KUL67_04830, partial [Bacillus spizizenii]
QLYTARPCQKQRRHHEAFKNEGMIMIPSFFMPFFPLFVKIIWLFFKKGKTMGRTCRYKKETAYSKSLGEKGELR